MDRKAIARETLEIMRQGYYLLPAAKTASKPSDASSASVGKRIDILDDMKHSIDASLLISPAEGEKLLKKYEKPGKDIEKSTDGRRKTKHKITVENLAAVAAIRRLHEEGKASIGVLNFASAKNPGGGFLNGAMAQEESLAASGTLYRALTRHEEYYRKNRAQSSMMYTDYAIYAPDVIFFRDENFRLAAEPVKASVLTLPAVNMGQILLKGEDPQQAEAAMKRRMKLALCIFAEQGANHLVLGAYGCGVFRNDPRKIAAWWQTLLEEGMGDYFDSIFHAVLDRSRNQECIRAFEQFFSPLMDCSGCTEDNRPPSTFSGSR